MEELKEHNKPIVEIATGGDLVLVVGPEMAKLRVNSLLLKTASKPFSAMLGPNWQEGQSLLGHNVPAEISLPEDNSEALELICTIIHHQNSRVPTTIAANKVLAVATTADKYDCVEAMKFAGCQWLRPQEESTPRDLIFLAAAAYLFRDAVAFKEITKALVLNHDGPFLELASEDIESVMTWKVFCLLEEQRSLARMKFAEILMGGINLGGCTQQCGWSSKYAYAYLQLLRNKNLWPTGLLCLSTALKTAEVMSDPIPQEGSANCSYAYMHNPPDYRIARQFELRGRDWTGIGLCLQCVLAGNPQAFCKESHDWQE